jgi:hypothetical protein
MCAVVKQAIFAACVFFCIHRLDQITKCANHSGAAVAIIGVSRANTQVIYSNTALFPAALHKFPAIQLVVHLLSFNTFVSLIKLDGQAVKAS